MSSNTKTLEVITVEAYPDSKGSYNGQFVLPLTYDVNITNELTSRMRSTGPSGELLKYDEFTFIDLSKNKYKARDLWLTGQQTQNKFRYEKDGTWVTGAYIFRFTCNDFTQIN
jgi:hypothetical protein